MSDEEKLVSRLLAFKSNVRPDDVTAHYSSKDCALSIKIIEKSRDETHDTVLLEGSQETLLFLADLVLSQASDTLDCGFGLSPGGPGSIFFDKNTRYGLYLHALPCANDSMRPGESTREPDSHTGETLAAKNASGLEAGVYSKILQRVFHSDRSMSRPLAEVIMSLGFSGDDADRISELSDKANDNMLSQEEEFERQAYINISRVLSFWQRDASKVIYGS